MKFIKAGVPPNKQEFICGNCFRTFPGFDQFEEHWKDEHQHLQEKKEIS